MGAGRAVARIGVHLGHVNSDPTPLTPQLLPHDHRSTGVALDEQDDLPVLQQRRHSACHVGVRIASRNDDDQIGPSETRRQVRGREFHRGKRPGAILNVDATTLPDGRESLLVEIVQAYPITGDAEMRNQPKTA